MAGLMSQGSTDTETRASEGSTLFDIKATLDAPMYGICLGIGVPCLAVFFPDFTTKVVLAAIFFAVTHEYWVIEFTELRLQMKIDREIDISKLNAQKNSIILSFIGGLGVAAALWLLRIVSYGPVEVAIIAHSIYVAFRSYNLIDTLGTDLATGSPRASRTEHTSH